MASHDTSFAATAVPDLQNPRVVIDLFQRGAAANLQSPLRRGATVTLPPRGWLVIAGDLHDHVLNLQRILKLARLEGHADHYLVLQEVIHGRNRINGRDLSIRTLARVAAIKIQYPNQVHLLQANHELSQLGGEGILKDGVSVVESFNAGADYIYGNEAPYVRQAMAAFIRSLPLAVKCPNGILCCHSLPSPRKLVGFDEAVISRVPTEQDLSFQGAAYDMVWGRGQTQLVLDELSEAWGVKLFVMGHQPADMGYEVLGESALILASDHERGAALPIKLNQPYTMQGLIDQVVPLASVRG